MTHKARHYSEPAEGRSMQSYFCYYSRICELSWGQSACSPWVMTPVPSPLASSFFKAPRRCQACGAGGGAHVQLLPFLKTICFGHGMCVQWFSHIRWDTPTSLCCGLDWVESLGSPEWRCWRCYGVLGVDVFWTGHEFGELDHSCILMQANILPSGCSTSTLPPFAFSALH